MPRELRKRVKRVRLPLPLKRAFTNFTKSVSYLWHRVIPLRLFQLERWLRTSVSFPIKTRSLSFKAPRSFWIILIAIFLWILAFLLTPHRIVFNADTLFASPPPDSESEAFEVESRELRASGYFLGTCTYGVSLLIDVPSDWGDASDWAVNARADGWDVSKVPTIGAVAQDNWGLNGAGHVAVVRNIQGEGVLVEEMNYYGNGGGWGVFSERWTLASEWSSFISR